MVVLSDLDDAEVDRLFHALADATRRDIVRRAVEGELSVSALAAAYAMSFAAVQKHVAVLEQAGLVSKTRRGRETLVRSDPETVDRARHALDQLAEAWKGRVQRMSDLLDTIPNASGPIASGPIASGPIASGPTPPTQGE